MVGKLVCSSMYRGKWDGSRGGVEDGAEGQHAAESRAKG